jgi:hypothetical protein
VTEDSTEESARKALAQQEAIAREVILESQRRWDETWKKASPGGKVFLSLLVLGAILPLLFQIAFIFVLWLVIYPSVSGVLHWAVVSSILALLLAVAYQVRLMATKGASLLYIMAGPSKRSRRSGQR